MPRPKEANKNAADPEPESGRGWGASIREAGQALESQLAPVASRVGDAVGRGASRVGRAVEHGATRVGEALEDPAAEHASEVLTQADLPELESSAPLASLGLRLDHEADLFRGVAMRQLARAAWVDRIAVGSVVAMLVSVVVLVGIAAFRALFAHGPGFSGVALLLFTGAFIMVAGAGVATYAALRIRRGQLDVAREALARADLGELRIHRLAVLLDLRVVDPEAYRSALRTLDGEIRSGR